MLALPSPSLLAFDHQRIEGHVGTLDGLDPVPWDTPMRERRDPVSPASLRPSCKSVWRHLQRGQALAERVLLEGHSCLARDGTGYVASQTMHCPSGLQKVHRHGSTTSSHPMGGAALRQPDVRAVMPRMPEAMVPQAGTATNDGERKAANRCMAKLRQDPPHRTGLVPADRLRATAPPIETLHDAGCHSILGVTEGDQAYWFKHVQAAEHAGRVTA